MNELLRLANELISGETRVRIIYGGSEAIADPNNVIQVIEGYQGLLRRIVETFDDRKPYQYGALVGELSGLLSEARESIPRGADASE